MKLSELIVELKHLRGEHGDLDAGETLSTTFLHDLNGKLEGFLVETTNAPAVLRPAKTIVPVPAPRRKR